jgi:hypothetical protein
MSKKFNNWVRPGVLLTLAVLLLPEIWFKTDDFPALDLPAKATSAPKPGGQRFKSGALVRKVASSRSGSDSFFVILIYNPRSLSLVLILTASAKRVVASAGECSPV